VDSKTQAGAIMKDIVFSSTMQLAAAIRAGHVSATEVLEAHLAQIDKHNPALNAIVTMDAEQAHKRAHEADEALSVHFSSPNLPGDSEEVTRFSQMGSRHFSPAQSPLRSRSPDSGQNPPCYVLIV
jgi:hypothetical protein